MKRALAAGALYFLLIFLLGMALGTIRVLVVEPRLGAVTSVLLELPFMLAASWFVCGWLIRYLSVPAALPTRAVMGTLAFLLLMGAELGLSLFAVDGSVREHFANYGQAAPLIGLLGQLGFGAFPFFRQVEVEGIAPRRRPGSSGSGGESGPRPSPGNRLA